MSGGTLVLIVVFALLAAVVLDLWVLRGLAQRIKARGLGRGVHIFGAYSPLLTLLRYGTLHPNEPPAVVEHQANLNQNPEPPSPPETQPARSNPLLEALRNRPVQITRRSALIELALLTVAVGLYCANILDFGRPTDLPGAESSIFQVLDVVLYNSIRIDHVFPMWNPYLRTGLPYAADPMLHAYNPFSSLPVLVFGVRDGFKLAVFLGFWLAAVGMWWLGLVLGMGPPGRVWAALMFVFAGQPAARFFQGQYLFIFGFAWIPWTVGGLFRLAQRGSRRYIALTAAALGLSFFSGNAYYTFYLLFGLLIFALIMAPQFSRSRPRFSLDLALLKRLALTCVLALGLVSIQLFPLLEFWPRLNKSMEIAGAHTIKQIFLDYTSKDTFRPDAYDVLPAREEFYAYVGLSPFIGLAALPFAFALRKKRLVLVFLALAVFVVLWVDMDLMPWYNAYLQARILLQFRHLLRILIFGSFALLTLASLGIDSAWSWLAEILARGGERPTDRLRSAAAFAGLAALGVLLVWGVSDVYRTNRVYLVTELSNERVGAAARWLRQYDLTDTYTRANPNNMAQKELVAARLRFIEVWYHFGDFSSMDGSISRRPILPGPHYVLQTAGDPQPENPSPLLVGSVEGYDLYRIESSLPYAFTVKNNLLMGGDPTVKLAKDEVTAFTSYSPGPNRTEVIASGQGDETLVVLTTHYPGWRLKIDGHSARLENAFGYLAAQTLPGTHRYEFIFEPASFYAGLLITLLCSGILLFMVLGDLAAGVRAARAAVWGLPGTVRRRREQIASGLYRGRWVADADILPDGLALPAEVSEAPGARLHLSVDGLAGRMTPGRAAWQRWLWASADLLSSWAQSLTLPGVLFGAALLVYAVTRFYALERFPIYFFGDEAVQALFGEDLLTRHFHGADGSLLPMYVEAAGQRWTPLISMYFHALTLTLFGKSIFIARGTSAAVSLLAAGAVSLTLKQIFKARYWWVGALLVALAPAWFLHSRTAFETVMTASFYACFLLFYLLYRIKSPRYLYAAIIFGAATFYSYSNAQAIILAAAGLLFLSDLRYHLRHPALLARGLALVAVLAIPFISFRLNHPAAISEHLRMVGSYWYEPAPLADKLLGFARRFAYGLSPQYWFFSNTHDLDRHRMPGMGHILTAMLPLYVIGLVLCLWRIRSPQHRAVILAALATPVGAALVDIGIARVLAFIVPACLLIGLGLEWLLEKFKERLPYRWLALALFAGLAWANLALLRTALVDGPLWFRDYGLYGMQYGARQLFEEAIPAYLEKHPQAKVMVTSTWANGPDNFIRFFVPPEDRDQVTMNGINAFQFKRQALGENDVFVMSPAEYDQAAADPKFTGVTIDETIPYPDGTPGFHFVRLRYSDNADAVFIAEAQARRQLLEGTVMVDGQTAAVRYSRPDMGSPDLIFDKDLFTLMRGMEANPFVLDFTFPEARTLSALDADFGMVNIQITLQLYESADSQPVTYQQTFRKDGADPQVHMPLADPPDSITRLRIEILNIEAGETANIHIRELILQP